MIDSPLFSGILITAAGSIQKLDKRDRSAFIKAELNYERNFTIEFYDLSYYNRPLRIIYKRSAGVYSRVVRE